LSVVRLSVVCHICAVCTPSFKSEPFDVTTRYGIVHKRRHVPRVEGGS